jgi:cation diffusion facilitator CzcD-associated flavoprotein CzcO
VQHFDHIIIGAGISGIAASLTLTNAKAQHLLIEARDRIGGRISSFTFAGTTQDQGASYLHYLMMATPYIPLPRNSISDKSQPTLIMRQFTMQSIKAYLQIQTNKQHKMFTAH